jgi:hypothetical protein
VLNSRSRRITVRRTKLFTRRSDAATRPHPEKPLPLQRVSPNAERIIAIPRGRPIRERTKIAEKALPTFTNAGRVRKYSNESSSLICAGNGMRTAVYRHKTIENTMRKNDTT